MPDQARLKVFVRPQPRHHLEPFAWIRRPRRRNQPEVTAATSRRADADSKRSGRRGKDLVLIYVI